MSRAASRERCVRDHDPRPPTMNANLQPHILALDDDPSIRSLVADYLRENELRVTAVATGKELTESMARETFDLVILDVRLQGEDGMQIARKLRNPQGVLVDLTKGEFSLLAAFLSSPQRVLTRDQLLDLSRLHNAEVYDRTIDVQILRLRRKVEADPAHPQFITTERGAGYVFAAPVEIVR